MVKWVFLVLPNFFFLRLKATKNIVPKSMLLKKCILSKGNWSIMTAPYLGKWCPHLDKYVDCMYTAWLPLHDATSAFYVLLNPTPTKLQLSTYCKHTMLWMCCIISSTQTFLNVGVTILYRWWTAPAPCSQITTKAAVPVVKLISVQLQRIWPFPNYAISAQKGEKLVNSPLL